MAKIALIPEGVDEKSEFLKNLGIPVNYMEDYSVLAIVVDRYDESVAVLKKSGFVVENLMPGSIIRFDDPKLLVNMLGLFSTNRIRCTYQDIADSFYQA
ncbi:MAG: hypothetical protein ACR2PB_06920 [Desulfocapsaceae bacterium]